MSFVVRRPMVPAGRRCIRESRRCLNTVESWRTWQGYSVRGKGFCRGRHVTGQRTTISSQKTQAGSPRPECQAGRGPEARARTFTHRAALPLGAATVSR